MKKLPITYLLFLLLLGLHTRGMDNNNCLQGNNLQPGIPTDIEELNKNLSPDPSEEESEEMVEEEKKESTKDNKEKEKEDSKKEEEDTGKTEDNTEMDYSSGIKEGGPYSPPQAQPAPNNGWKMGLLPTFPPLPLYPMFLNSGLINRGLR